MVRGDFNTFQLKNKTKQKTPYESFMIQAVRLGCLNSVRIVFFSFLSEKESAKRKKGSKLFPFRVDPFQKGLGWNVSSCFYLLQHHHHHHHNHQGPVVQSVVSLTSSLRIISLTILADSIHNILIFFAEKISAYLRIT